MGGGASLVDGIRRLFQRRTTAASKSSDDEPSHHHNYNNGDRNANGHDTHSFVRDLRAQLATIPSPDTEEGEGAEEGLKIEVDIDITGLKLIKVPTRANFKAAASMDPQKKVYSLILLPSLFFFRFSYSS